MVVCAFMEPMIRSGKTKFSSCRQSFQLCVLFQCSSWWHLELCLPGSISRANLHSRWDIQRRLSWRVPFPNQVSRTDFVSSLQHSVLAHRQCVLYEESTNHDQTCTRGGGWWQKKRLDVSDRNKIREELQKHTKRIFAEPEDRLSNIMEQLHPRKSLSTTLSTTDYS